MKLKKLKLNQLSREDLNSRRMNSLRGGSCLRLPGCDCERCSIDYPIEYWWNYERPYAPYGPGGWPPHP